MSGGHFDYRYNGIADFADQLKQELEVNNNKTVDRYGDTVGRNLSLDITYMLSEIQIWAEAAGEMAKQVDLLYSADIGEYKFKQRIDEILVKAERL